MPKIIDPDGLTTGVSVFWETGSIIARTIGISSSATVLASLIPPLQSGSDSGVSFQTLYSFAKEEWKADSSLIRIPFPFISITKNQFDIQNNWNFANDASRFLVRDAGWSVISASIVIEEWAGVRTLGTLGFDATPAGSDQVYYVQSGSSNGSGDAVNNVVQNFKMSGSVNQAIMHYSASDLTTNRNFRGSTTLYVREYTKIYDDASIQTDLGVGDQEYTLYSVPLQNLGDLKISTTAESQAATEGPWAFVDIYFLTGSGFSASGSIASPYTAGTVVSGSDGQWYIDNNGGTDTGPAPGGDWVPYAFLTAQGTPISGSAQISGSGEYSPFNVVITNGTGSAVTTGSISDVYTAVQYQLRLSTDIDKAGQFPANTYIGKVAPILLSFVGDTLVTSNGVLVLNQQDADTNSIDFLDVSGSLVRYPFVATGVISFNSNIQAEHPASASYFMFFTDLSSEGGLGQFGSSSAIIVEDNDTVQITGPAGGTSSVSFTFDYDGNVQGGRGASQDAAITLVAIGLESAQYVVATSTIERTKANNISLVAALERNYSNP